MTETELRMLLVRALKDANVLGLPDDATEQLFVSGSTDIAFENLEIDSLAMMQLCIAIEMLTGISVVPRGVRRMRFLSDLIHELSGNPK